MLNRIVEKIDEKKRIQIREKAEKFLTALENTIDKDQHMNYAFHLTNILSCAVPECFKVRKFDYIYFFSKM